MPSRCAISCALARAEACSPAVAPRATVLESRARRIAPWSRTSRGLLQRREVGGDRPQLAVEREVAADVTHRAGGHDAAAAAHGRVLHGAVQPAAQHVLLGDVEGRPEVYAAVLRTASLEELVGADRRGPAAAQRRA